MTNVSPFSNRVDPPAEKLSMLEPVIAAIRDSVMQETAAELAALRVQVEMLSAQGPPVTHVAAPQVSVSPLITLDADGPTMDLDALAVPMQTIIELLRELIALERAPIVRTVSRENGVIVSMTERKA